jgi:hypothetical protein
MSNTRLSKLVAKNVTAVMATIAISSFTAFPYRPGIDRKTLNAIPACLQRFSWIPTSGWSPWSIRRPQICWRTESSEII